MHGSPFLGPLALLGYSVILVALSYLSVRYFKLGSRINSCLRYIPGLSLSTLPAPASSSTSSLTTSLSRKLKTAKTAAAKNAPHLPLRDTPRWSFFVALFTRRWRRRIMLEELPTTASSEDERVPPDLKKAPPVLVDLSETSTVLSPSIPLRVLAAAGPLLRSPAPLLSTSNILETPPLTAGSTSSRFSIGSPSLPSTPPPYQSPGTSFGHVSSLSSPPSKGKEPDFYFGYPVAQRSHNLIYPPSRPRTPSPISHNPHFLSTSPAPFGHHRRTRSLGGINVRRVAATPHPSMLFNSIGGEKYASGPLGTPMIESAKFSSRQRLTSRSTELLVDLEGGVGYDANQCVLPDDALVDVGEEIRRVHSPDIVEVDLELGRPTPPLIAESMRAAVEETVDAGHQVGISKAESNSAWRHWDHDDEDLLSLNPDALPAIFPTPYLSTNTVQLENALPPLVLRDLCDRPPLTPHRSPDLFDEPFGEAFEEVSTVTFPSTEKLTDDAVLPGLQKGHDGEDGAEAIEEEHDLEAGIYASSPTLELEMKASELFTGSSQMPTPPASPPFPLLRMPSVSDFTAQHDSSTDEGDLIVEVAVANTSEECTSESGDVVEEACDVDAAESGLLDQEDDSVTGPLPAVSAESVVAAQFVDVSLETIIAAGDDRPDVVRRLDHDDPPVPEMLPTDTLEHQEIREEDEVAVAASDLDDLPEALEDPPLPDIPSIDTERSRPAWSVRAAEASRLGMVTTEEPSAPKLSDTKEAIPGAFPEIAQTSEIGNAAVEVSGRGSRPRSASTSHLGSMDTSSFAAAILSLRRRPEPLDIALAMQMRPGLGAGADPAWMVRFMMAVYGWVAVAMSAGID